MKLLRIADKLNEEVRDLCFGEPVRYVYNPLEYAREPYNKFVRRYARKDCEVVLVGMNPGPFGMAQVGVPFGDVAMVRDWLGITGRVGKPGKEHPKRPVEGFNCPRGEVSGKRLWGWARDRFGTPEDFFERFLILNYCPLVFMEESGKNRTPDKLRKKERGTLFEVCNRALRESVEYLRPSCVCGVGNFAAARAAEALDGLQVKVGRVLHPSPQSPAANRGWARTAEKQLAGYGIELPAARSRR